DAKTNPERHFFRIRFKNPKADIDGKVLKYYSPKGSGNFPYFTPSLRKAYKSGTEIPFLVVTEGEFKAWVACEKGIPTVGVSGIHNFYSNDGARTLHSELEQFIIRCKVKKILFLTDADTMIITYKQDKDLAERPTLFYSAVKYFREATMKLMGSASSLVGIYFGHLRTDNFPISKGLDDLLLNNPGKEAEVASDLQELMFATKFFNIINIEDSLTK